MFVRSAVLILFLACLHNCILGQTTPTTETDPAVENSDYALVASKLDPGGTSYYYTNIDGAVDSLISFFKPLGAINAQAQGIISMAEAGIKKLGLTQLNDFGMSTARLKSGVTRKKCYLALKQRTGLFALAGGEPKVLASARYVPADAAAAWCGNADLSKLLPLIREVAEAAMGGAGRGMVDQLLQSANKQTGVDIEKTLEALGDEWGLHLYLPNKTAGSESEKEAMAPFVFRIRVTSDALLEVVKSTVPQFAKMEKQPEIGSNAVWTIEPNESKAARKFYLAAGKDWLVVSNSLDRLKESEAAEGSDNNLWNSAGFQKLGSGMPRAVNGVSFISPEYVQYTDGAIAQAFDQGSKSSESEGAGEQKALLEAFQKMLKQYGLVTSYAAWRVNDPRGIQWVQVGASNTQPASLVAVASAGVVVAVAVPAFLRARENSRGRACQANLAKMDAAKEQFALENKLSDGSKVSWDQLKPYLPKEPTCPGGGSYTLGQIGTKPACSIGRPEGSKFEPHELE